MNLGVISRETSNFYVPRYVVEINNRALSEDVSGAVVEVSVEEKIDEGANFKLQFNDEFNLNTQKFKWLDDPLFTEGNVVIIKMGYSNNLNTMIKGKITSIESSFFSGGIPTFTVEGHDLSFDYLKRRSPERTFVDKSYSEIAKTIASEAQLTPVVDDTGKFKPSRRKDNDESYFVFLQRLAKEMSYRFDVDRDTLFFKKPEDEKNEILTFELGRDIISFRPRLNTTRLYSEVEVRGHNPKDPNTPIVGIARAGSERKQEGEKTQGSQLARTRYREVRKVITNVVVNSIEEAEEMARAELNKASDTLIEGDGECIGIPQLKKGINIRLEKLGTRFSGKYYVKKTTHTINNNGYKTTFSVKRNAV